MHSQQYTDGMSKIWLSAMTFAVIFFSLYFVSVYRQSEELSEEIVLAAREHGSKDLAQLFQAALGQQLYELVELSTNDNEKISATTKKVRALFGATSIIKVTLYDPKTGKIFYSTERAEIGRTNPSVSSIIDSPLRMSRTRIVDDTAITNFDGIAVRENIIATQVPLYRRDQRTNMSLGEIVLIAEIYSDSSGLSLHASTLRGDSALKTAILTAMMLSLTFVFIWLFQVRCTNMRIKKLDAGDS